MQKALLADAKVFFSFLLLSFFLFFADYFNILDFPKSLVQVVTSPIQYGFYQTGLLVQKQFEFLVLAGYALDQNKMLSEQLTQVLENNANLRKQVAELSAFAEQQKALNTQTFTLIPAHPIGLSRYLYLDKGSDDKLKVGEVVVFKNSYLGKIDSVSPKKAEVILASDPDSHLTAFADNAKGKAKGVLSGNFGAQMLMDKILHDESISNGDLVYTEGSEVNIPRGLVLGQVTAVDSQDDAVFKQATVTPIFDVTNLDLVFVIAD